MSCIRFNTPAQQAQIREALLTGRPHDEPVAQFLSPTVTESKIKRLVTMSTDENPKIRESVALSHHAPAAVYNRLATDPDPGVRECLARNPHTTSDLLRQLATDSHERVRAFVVVNDNAPDDALDTLSHDGSDLVRALVDWKNRVSEPDVVRA
jgi:hypothetical protein